MKTLALALALAVAATTANAATIANGSFEFGSAVGSASVLFSGSTAIDDWTVSNGSVDYVGSYWQAADGGRSLDLNGYAPGGVSTNINDLANGSTYNIVFSMSGNPDNSETRPSDPLKTLGVEVDGNLIGTFDFNTAIAQNSRSVMGWVDMVATFTATATISTLRFFAIGPNDSRGPALDNVRINLVPVPVPASLGFVLAGLAGLAMLRRRRRLV